MVSILISPERLMLPTRDTEALPDDTSFNPHQPRKADATIVFLGRAQPNFGFNPHQPRKADATPFSRVFVPKRMGFNPHQPRKADATYQAQISNAAGTVSILISPERLMLRSSIPSTSCFPKACFNPHQPRKADATKDKYDN